MQMRRVAAAKTAMAQPLKLLTMYANRCNALWAEQQQWEPPLVHMVQNFSAVAGGGKVRAATALARRPRMHAHPPSLPPVCPLKPIPIPHLNYPPPMYPLKPARPHPLTLHLCPRCPR